MVFEKEKKILYCFQISPFCFLINIQMTRQAAITVIAASFNPFYMSCRFFFFLSMFWHKYKVLYLNI